MFAAPFGTLSVMAGTNTTRRAWASAVGAFGHSYVFWPVLIGGAVLCSGPGRWPSPLLWLAVVTVTGPLLSLGLWKLAQRPKAPAAT